MRHGVYSQPLYGEYRDFSSLSGVFNNILWDVQWDTPFCFVKTTPKELRNPSICTLSGDRVLCIVCQRNLVRCFAITGAKALSVALQAIKSKRWASDYPNRNPPLISGALEMTSVS